MTPPSLSGHEHPPRCSAGRPYVRDGAKGKEAAMFRGSIPALVTPFRDEALAEGVYRAFVAWQIAEGSHGLVPCGTTGEGATLDSAEHRRAIEICVGEAGGKGPVIGGRGPNEHRPG